MDDHVDNPNMRGIDNVHSQENKDNLGLTRLDVNNYFSERKQRSIMYRDVVCPSQYFQRQLLENPSFFFIRIPNGYRRKNHKCVLV